MSRWHPVAGDYLYRRRTPRRSRARLLRLGRGALICFLFTGLLLILVSTFGCGAAAAGSKGLLWWETAE